MNAGKQKGVPETSSEKRVTAPNRPVYRPCSLQCHGFMLCTQCAREHLMPKPYFLLMGGGGIH